ncbi:lamin tail domain-containing protein [Candidatus Peregrinibacteria bacterium]|nr:lamin tail domain-containing protein [Candidatus Peregrinibacteria bacterium]
MQKKLLAIIVLFLWIFYPFSMLAEEVPPMPALIITEIAAFEQSETEWIEIYNESETSIDLTGWKFFEDETNHGLSVFRGDFLLDSNEYAVIANKADLVAQKYPEFIGTLFDSNWGSLKEEGEEIGIKDADGNFLERFIYPQTGSSTSLERIATEPMNWTPHPTSHSMGRAREISAVPAPIEIGTSTEAEVPLPEPTPVPPPLPSPSPSPSPPPPPPPLQTPQSPPQAVIQIQSGSLIAQGETTLNFDGRASFDPDGNRLNFFWDFGDGTTSNSENPGFHKYSVPGFYTVTLTVTDPDGASGKNYQYVQVLNKSVVAPMTPVPPTPPITPLPQFSLPPTFPQQTATLPFPGIFPPGTTELRGYFVFAIPSAPSEAAPPTKQKLVPKKNTPKKDPQNKNPKRTKKNASKNGDLSADIKITELFPAPSQNPQSEWIEIQNTGSKTINLGNWMLADEKKTSSPYLIPDSMELKPGKYAVFQKGATKINLNNDRDTVFLADFEGNVLDSVAYADAKKDFSYALISVAYENDLVASAQPLPLREKNENAWEWIDAPTPGTQNPVFEKIDGRVSKLLAGGDLSFDIAAPDGKSKKIRFNEAILDPLTAEAIIKEGAGISVQAEKEIDGSYALKNIDDVRPAPEQTGQNAVKNSTVLWIAIGVLALSFLLNGIPLLLALKKWRASRAEYSQKDEIVKPETKSDQRRFF